MEAVKNLRSSYNDYKANTSAFRRRRMSRLCSTLFKFGLTFVSFAVFSPCSFRGGSLSPKASNVFYLSLREMAETQVYELHTALLRASIKFRRLRPEYLTKESWDFVRKNI